MVHGQMWCWRSSLRFLHLDPQAARKRVIGPETSKSTSSDILPTIRPHLTVPLLGDKHSNL